MSVLVEGLRLAVYGGYGLPDEVAHPRSRTDDRRPRRDADANQPQTSPDVALHPE
jgi:hypothetical protein